MSEDRVKLWDRRWFRLLAYMVLAAFAAWLIKIGELTGGIFLAVLVAIGVLLDITLYLQTRRIDALDREIDRHKPGHN